MPLNMLECQNTMFASGNITFLKILVVDWPWHTNGLSQMKISILIPIPHEIYTQRWKIDWSHLFLVSICVWDVMRSGPRTTQSAYETSCDLVPGRLNLRLMRSGPRTTQLVFVNSHFQKCLHIFNCSVHVYSVRQNLGSLLISTAICVVTEKL